MITFKAKIKWNNHEQLALELEHIAGLIRNGYPSGVDWTIEEVEEKEKLPIIEIEEEEIDDEKEGGNARF